MPQRPIQIHIVVTHDSGREAGQSYLRDDDGWHLHQEVGGEVFEATFDATNDALMSALQSVREAFGTMHEVGDAPLPDLIPVDTRETAGPPN